MDWHLKRNKYFNFQMLKVIRRDSKVNEQKILKCQQHARECLKSLIVTFYYKLAEYHSDWIHLDSMAFYYGAVFEVKVKWSKLLNIFFHSFLCETKLNEFNCFALISIHMNSHEKCTMANATWIYGQKKPSQELDCESQSVTKNITTFHEHRKFVLLKSTENWMWPECQIIQSDREQFFWKKFRFVAR